MSVAVVGLPALQRRLTAIANGRPLLRELQIRSVRGAKIRVPRKTGNTGRTIRPGELTDDHAIVEAGGAAVFLERGTRPHIIRPRKGRALAWPSTNAGRRLSGRARTGAGMTFATVVHHPGTKPQPFLLPAVIDAVHEVGAEPIVHAWNDAA